MSSATDESGQRTAFTYNPAGQLLSITPPARAANGGAAETTSYSYDGSGHLKTISLPESGATIGFVYDGFGRVQSTTATDGEVISYTYDGADRLTTIGYADGTNENLFYNKLDMEWHQDRGGFWTHYVHNALRQLAIVEDPRGKFTLFDWCACGALSSVTDPRASKTRGSGVGDHRAHAA